MDKLITKSFKRLLDKGIHRGFITYEELTKSLGKRHYNQENIEKSNLNINLPNFVGKKVKNLKRSINIEKTKQKLNDIQINTIKENDLIKCRIEIISH